MDAWGYLPENPKAAKGFLLSPQAALLGHGDVVGFGGPDFYVRFVDKATADRLIIANHYSRKIYQASHIHFGVFLGGDLVGALQFGPAMNPASAGKIVAGATLKTYLELNRMWLDDRAPRNSETRALACAWRVIRRAFPRVEWIQSFADERCGRLGVVYQAANFTYCGEHETVFYELDGVFYHRILMTRRRDLSATERALQARRHEALEHRLRQFRYLYFLEKRARRRLLLTPQPYPKPRARGEGPPAASDLGAAVAQTSDWRLTLVGVSGLGLRACGRDRENSVRFTKAPYVEAKGSLDLGAGESGRYNVKTIGPEKVEVTLRLFSPSGADIRETLTLTKDMGQARYAGDFNGVSNEAYGSAGGCAMRVTLTPLATS
eukprot:g13659.t1